MCQGCYQTWTKLLDQWSDEFFPQTKVCVFKIEFFPFLPVLNILPVVVQASSYMENRSYVTEINDARVPDLTDRQQLLLDGGGASTSTASTFTFIDIWQCFLPFFLSLHSFRFASFKESKEQSPRLREVELKVSAKRCFFYFYFD